MGERSGETAGNKQIALNPGYTPPRLRHFTRVVLPGILGAMSNFGANFGPDQGQTPDANARPIQMRQTPNPNARKFVLAGIRFEGSRNYALGQAVDHPLAARLLALEGVYNVFLAQDFVTVNKAPGVEWMPLQSAVEHYLADYLAQTANNNAG